MLVVCLLWLWVLPCTLEDEHSRHHGREWAGLLVRVVSAIKQCMAMPLPVCQRYPAFLVALCGYDDNCISGLHTWFGCRCLFGAGLHVLSLGGRAWFSNHYYWTLVTMTRLAMAILSPNQWVATSLRAWSLIDERWKASKCTEAPFSII